MRAEKEARLHRNLLPGDLPPASDALLDALAERLAARHAAMCEEDVDVVSEFSATPSWFKLFREVDADGSGLIAYDEFQSMVREMLGLDEEEVTEESLMAAWRALDEDGSGHIASGEFGAFMRRGEHVYKAPRGRAGARGWSPRTRARRTTSAPRSALFHTARPATADGAAAASADDVTPIPPPGAPPPGAVADEAELDALSARLHLALATGDEDAPRLRYLEASASFDLHWYRLFRQMDRDGDGLATYQDFHGLVRDALGVGADDVSDAALRRAWRALEDDGAGRVAAGPFGAFMRRGERERDATPPSMYRAAEQRRRARRRRARGSTSGRRRRRRGASR